MGKISNLQQRVDAAEQAFREVDDQHTSYNERLMELIEAVKSSLRQKLADMTQNQMEYERMAQEYQQLSDMLRSLTTSVEAGGRSRVSHLMHNLEVKSTPAPSPIPATEIATPAPARTTPPRAAEPEIQSQDNGIGRASEDDTELLDYVDRESFRSGMQRVLKKKPRAASPKLSDLSDVPAT